MIYEPFDDQVYRWRHRYLQEPLPDLLNAETNSDHGELPYDLDYFPLEEHSCGSEMLPIAEDMYAPCNYRYDSHLDWEYPLAFNLIGFPFVLYFNYLIVCRRLRFSFTSWGWSHQIMFCMVLCLFGVKSFMWTFIWPTVNMWFLVVAVFVIQQLD
jgi:hypothetical protein